MTFVACLRWIGGGTFGAAVSTAFSSPTISGSAPLADPQVWVLQKVPRLLDPRARDVLHEVHPSRLLEFLAEITRAHVHDPRDCAEREFIAEMIADMAAGARDCGGLGDCAFQREQVAARRQVPGKDREQSNERFILPQRKNARVEVSLF